MSHRATAIALLAMVTSTALAAPRANGGAKPTLWDLSSVETLANGLPILHSNPGAPVSLFIDFQFESNDGKARTFSLDPDLTAFDQQEQEQIKIAWAKTANAFAPFDVDVTTIEPDPKHPYIWQAVLNQPGSGGSSGTTGYVPLSGQKAAQDGSQRADGYRWCGRCAQGSVLHAVIIHESGHAHGISGHEMYDEDGNRVGIQHAGIERGPFTRSVGPIGGWYNWLSEWGHPKSNPAGIYWVVNDVDIITSQIVKGARTYSDPDYAGDGFRRDDHANARPGATEMTWEQSQVTWIGRGIIERLNDTDVLSFPWQGGTAWICVRTALPTPLLDARLILYDQAGNTVGVADPPESMQPVLRVEDLGAGAYYVGVSSDGDYGELGMYEVTVSASLPEALSLLSHLPFTDESLTDSSGRDNEVAWRGTPQWVTGPDGTPAAGFDGSNRIIISPGARGFTPPGLSPLGRTIAFWFKGNVDAPGRAILCQSPGRAGYQLYIEGGRLTAYAINDSGLTDWRGGTTLTCSVELERDRWYHVALTHRTTFSQVEDSFALYLDGEEVARGAAGPVPAASQFEVGGAGFEGAIDDVRIFGEVVPRHLIAEFAGRADLSARRPVGAAMEVAATASHDSVQLSWAAVDGATGYEILRSCDNRHFEAIGSVTADARTFTDPRLASSSRYVYVVRAVGADGVGAADVTTRGGPVRNLRFSRLVKGEEPDPKWSNPLWGHQCEGTHGIVLNWLEPDGHRDTSLRIERATDGADFAPLITLPSTECVYCDHNLAPGTEYTYRVVTLDEAGEASSALIRAPTFP